MNRISNRELYLTSGIRAGLSAITPAAFLPIAGILLASPLPDCSISLPVELHAVYALLLHLPALRTLLVPFLCYSSLWETLKFVETYARPLHLHISPLFETSDGVFSFDCNKNSVYIFLRGGLSLLFSFLFLVGYRIKGFSSYWASPLSWRPSHSHVWWLSVSIAAALPAKHRDNFKTQKLCTGSLNLQDH